MAGGPGKNIEFVNNQKTELLNNFNEYTDGKYKQVIAIKIEELEKEKKEFLLRKNNKLLYWMSNPKKTLFKISQSLLTK